jgi:hypothetical protein
MSVMNEHNMLDKRNKLRLQNITKRLYVSFSNQQYSGMDDIKFRCEDPTKDQRLAKVLLGQPCCILHGQL